MGEFECEVVRDMTYGYLTAKVFIPAKYGGDIFYFSRNLITDVVPKTCQHDKLLKLVLESIGKEMTYKDMGFMVDECKKIIRQAKEDFECQAALHHSANQPSLS